ncbi:MAG: beta-ketoacyl-[acyl-carrier-protein] synthase family protein [Mediterranea sp.]|jgi:3-oxoacyl-[acyl-carrier-protein] synthase-1|nr:beta-ketoacyl-[acyl-carrier-protein] synthase family protein [Mediterranea sp.]
MRVYVSGVGVVSGIGIGVEENMEALRQGRHGMGKVTLFPTTLDVPVSEVKLSNAALKQRLSLSAGRTFSRTALLGMMAGAEALRDASVDPSSLRIGLLSATSVGGMDLSERFYETFREDHRKGRLRQVASHDCGASTEQMAAYLGTTHYVTTISTACSSAANAIILGARLVRQGVLDVAIAGGTDALCRFTLNGFHSLMILDRAHCRPFDNSRAGLNLGEGAGYVVLQAASTLRRTPYCELSGYANVNEAYHQTGSSPDGDGAWRSMGEALRMAGVAPHEVSYINVHGTGTPDNDLSESKALRRIFGEEVPPFSSVKPFIGHTLGASEGIEAVYSILAIQRGVMYPSLNFTTPIAETGLVPLTQLREGTSIHHVLSNAFGFGGNDSSLLFSALLESPLTP